MSTARDALGLVLDAIQRAREQSIAIVRDIIDADGTVIKTLTHDEIRRLHHTSTRANAADVRDDTRVTRSRSTEQRDGIIPVSQQKAARDVAPDDAPAPTLYYDGIHRVEEHHVRRCMEDFGDLDRFDRGEIARADAYAQTAAWLSAIDRMKEGSK